MMPRRAGIGCASSDNAVVPWNLDNVPGVVEYEISVEVARGDGTLSEFDLIGRIAPYERSLVKAALEWLESIGQVERKDGKVRATDRMRELLLRYGDDPA